MIDRRTRPLKICAATFNRDQGPRADIVNSMNIYD
jgi:hypothetical protein